MTSPQVGSVPAPVPSPQGSVPAPVLQVPVPAPGPVIPGEDVDLGSGVWVAIGLYLGFLLVIGLASFLRRRQKIRAGEQIDDLSQHYIASGTLGYTVLTLTLFATMFSGYTVVGVPGESFALGFNAMRWIGGTAAVMIGFAVLAPRLRRISERRGGYQSGVDLVSDRYRNNPLRICIALTQLLCLLFYMIAQFFAMASTITGLSNGKIPGFAAMIVLGAIMLIYEALGGMQSVAWTDCLQGVLLFVGFVFIFIVQDTVFGGLPHATNYLANHPESPPNLVNVPTTIKSVSWLSFYILLLSFVLYGHQQQRIFASKNEKVLKTGLAVLTLCPLFVFSAGIVIGVIGRAWITEEFGIEKAIELAGSGSDNIFGTIMREIMLSGGTTNTASYGLGCIILAASVAALMSTADSALLAISCIINVDLIQPYLWKTATSAKLVWAGRAVSVGVTALAIGVAYETKLAQFNLTVLIVLQQNFLTQMAPSYIGALYFKGARPRPMLIGLLTGIFWTCIFDYVILTDDNVAHTATVGLAAGVPAIAINVLVTVLCHQIPLEFFNGGYVIDQTLERRFGPREDFEESFVGYQIPGWTNEIISGKFGYVLIANFTILCAFGIPWYNAGEALPILKAGQPTWVVGTLIVFVFVDVVTAVGYVFAWEEQKGVEKPTARVGAGPIVPVVSAGEVELGEQERLSEGLSSDDD